MSDYFATPWIVSLQAPLSTGFSRQEYWSELSCTSSGYFLDPHIEPLRKPLLFRSLQSQLCPTLCDPMNRSTPGLPVHYQLPEITQVHVHRVGDSIQPSYPLSSASPPALNLSQHQGLFKWVSSSHQVAKVLEFHYYVLICFQLKLKIIKHSLSCWSYRIF